ncbi:MAG: hypothetical protein ILP02_02625, partial [Clostridia bacterium]|nr:hypothetical protein [Clostridia bacterium]
MNDDEKTFDVDDRAANDADKTKDTVKNPSATKRIRIANVFLACVLVVLSVAAIPTLAWFYSGKNLAAYAPISTPESLFIGTGQREDIRYLYFSGIDVTKEKKYVDYVISVRGEGVGGYMLQLGYTTNNQFSYAIYGATESFSAEEGAVEYVPVNTSLSVAYYKASGEAISGVYLNKQEAVEAIAKTSDSYHALTYDSYDSVHKYAEPIYWQTADRIRLDSGREFTHYYILRVS